MYSKTDYYITRVTVDPPNHAMSRIRFYVLPLWAAVGLFLMEPGKSSKGSKAP